MPVEHILALIGIFLIILFGGSIDNYIKERRWGKKSIANNRQVMTYRDFPDQV